ncbi:MAG: hypothetical protein ACE5R6_18570 [Candidatus Heimdallarchaeota archaeon]
MSKEKISEEFLLHMYDATWEDIRHSRLQEWKVLEVTALAFIAMAGLGFQDEFKGVSVILGIFIMIFAMLGLLVTLRHRALFSEKMELIRNIETALGLDKADILPRAWKEKNGIKLFRVGSTSFFLMTIYVALAGASLIYVVFAIRGGVF